MNAYPIAPTCRHAKAYSGGNPCRRGRAVTRLPRVSIGLPVYNGQKYLPLAIESVLAQTFEDFELILSDNASTDATGEICNHYLNGDRRVHYVRNSVNVGGAENYNRVFRLAQGRYLKWLADDDLCEPQFLQQCVEVLDSRPEVVLCYPSTKVIDADGQEMPVPTTPCFVDPKDTIRRFRHFLDPVGIGHNPIFGLARRASLERTFLFRRHLCSDRCLVAQLALMGEFCELPQRLLVRRKHDRNVGRAPEDISFYDPAKNASSLSGVVPEMHVTRAMLCAIHWAPLRSGEKLRLGGCLGKWILRRRRDLAWQGKQAMIWMARKYLGWMLPRRRSATVNNP
ncbi:MAG: glycosyltransferase [Planctomycetaceae bacterium]|nr:glycosyltransferase [Planctomycetaceae bacterium]